MQTTPSDTSEPLKVGIVAGEKSGDYLASELIEALKARYPNAQFTGLCGPLMQAQGATTLAEMDKISIMGLEGLLGSVREILSIRRRLLDHFIADPPDVFIGVDVPDFNLALERKLKKAGIPTVHCVSPTVWAWRSGRIKKIRRAVNLMLTLFPFEQDFYQQHDVPVTFIGHPLAAKALQWPDVSEFRESLLGSGEILVALLPGSRMSEVSRLAPEMLAAATKLSEQRPGLRFVIPTASPSIHAWLQSRLPEGANIELIHGQSRDLLAACDLAALASGTAALEAALFAKPMVVMYKVAWLSALVFGHTIEVEHFSMPNHLTNPPAVPELMQTQASAQNLIRELILLLDDPERFQTMQAALAAIAPTLSAASGERAADAIVDLISGASRHSQSSD